MNHKDWYVVKFGHVGEQYYPIERVIIDSQTENTVTINGNVFVKSGLSHRILPTKFHARQLVKKMLKESKKALIRKNQLIQKRLRAI